MTTDELLSVIAAAKTRADIVPAYEAALDRETRGIVKFIPVNAAITEKWSKAGLKWIKQQAWKRHDDKVLARYDAAQQEAQP